MCTPTQGKTTFLILHTHGSIWKERGLLTSNRKEIKHAGEILKLLEAVQVPVQVADALPGASEGGH